MSRGTVEGPGRTMPPGAYALNAQPGSFHVVDVNTLRSAEGSVVTNKFT
jgi:hypothetical protein